MGNRIRWTNLSSIFDQRNTHRERETRSNLKLNWQNSVVNIWAAKAKNK